MSEQTKKEISPELQERFQYFVENADTVRIGRHINKIFFDYMRYQTTGLDVDFDYILNDVEKIIELMDTITDHYKKT
jgi:hypothetical protein